MQKKGEVNNTLKYVSLITLTLQNAILGLSMRYARTRDGDMFFSSTGRSSAELGYAEGLLSVVSIIFIAIFFCFDNISTVWSIFFLDFFYYFNENLNTLQRDLAQKNSVKKSFIVNRYLVDTYLYVDCIILLNIMVESLCRNPSVPAVLMSEVVKFVTCIAIVYVESGSVVGLFDTLNKQIIKQPIDTLKVCVPSLVYLIQNNLLYVSASNLDAATYQVTYQLKILTTALFSVFILKRSLLKTQWTSLLTLIIGVVLVQMAQGHENTTSKNAEGQSRFVGFMAALTACALSGFAGVYFEKILKGSDVTVWMRNVQLSLCSIPLGWISCYVYDGELIREKGFFFGYDKFVNYLVILQAVGGLIVAVVVKYADNILKGFATSLAIVIACIGSIYIFDFELSLQFVMGAAFVIMSIFLYGYQPKKPVESSGAFKV